MLKEKRKRTITQAHTQKLIIITGKKSTLISAAQHFSPYYHYRYITANIREDDSLIISCSRCLHLRGLQPGGRGSTDGGSDHRQAPSYHQQHS